jgi:hypothetical protein
MTRKRFCCGLLIVVLIVGAAKPSRAVDAEGVLIIIASAVAVAAIAVGVTMTIVHHKRNKIVVTGCVIPWEKGMKVTDEEDKKTYVLSGDTSGIKAGDRMKLEGKRVKAKSPDKSRVWETEHVIKDFGVCQPKNVISLVTS